jgi:hypothetical protein
MSDDNLINSKKINTNNVILNQEGIFEFYMSFLIYIIYFIITLVFIGCPILYNCKIAQSGILTAIYNNVTTGKNRGYCSPFNTISKENMSNEKLETTLTDENEEEDGQEDLDSENQIMNSSIPVQILATINSEPAKIPTDVILFLFKSKNTSQPSLTNFNFSSIFKGGKAHVNAHVNSREVSSLNSELKHDGLITAASTLTSEHKPSENEPSSHDGPITAASAHTPLSHDGPITAASAHTPLSHDGPITEAAHNPSSHDGPITAASAHDGPITAAAHDGPITAAAHDGPITEAAHEGTITAASTLTSNATLALNPTQLETEITTADAQNQCVEGINYGVINGIYGTYRDEKTCKQIIAQQGGGLGDTENDKYIEDSTMTIYEYWYNYITFDYESNINKVLHIFGSEKFSNFLYLYLTSSSWIKYKLFDNKKKFTYNSLKRIDKDNPVDWFITPISNFIYYIAEYCADVGREYCAFNLTIFQKCYEMLGKFLPDTVILFLPSFIIILSMITTGTSNFFFTIFYCILIIIQIIVSFYILYYSFIKFINYLTVFILTNPPDYYSEKWGILAGFLNCFYIIYYLIKIIIFIIIKIFLASIVFNISLFYLSFIQVFIYFYTCFYIPFSFIAKDNNDNKYTLFTLIKGLKYKQVWILFVIVCILIFHLFKWNVIKLNLQYISILIIFFLIITIFGYFTNTLQFDNDAGLEYEKNKNIITGKMSKYSFINSHNYSSLIERGLTPHSYEDYKNDCNDKGTYSCNSKLGHTASVKLEEDPRALDPEWYKMTRDSTIDNS